MSGTPTPERCPETQEVISCVTMQSDTQGYFYVAKAVRRMLNNFVQFDQQKYSSAIHPPKRKNPPLLRKSKTTTTPDNIQGKDKQLSKLYIHTKPL